MCWWMSLMRKDTLSITVFPPTEIKKILTLLIIKLYHVEIRVFVLNGKIPVTYSKLKRLQREN